MGRRKGKNFRKKGVIKRETEFGKTIFFFVLLYFRPDYRRLEAKKSECINRLGEIGTTVYKRFSALKGKKRKQIRVDQKLKKEDKN